MSSDPVADDVRRVFGDIGELAERLRARRLEPVVQPLRRAEAEDAVLAAARRERERVVTAGIEGLAKLARGRDDELDDTERFGLRAIVLLEGRPALLVQDGDFGRPPHEWARLGAAREGIQAVIARCGRIDVTGHLELDWLGTACLVAPGVVMTNQHVAAEFCARTGGRWTFRPHVTPRVDFLGEHERSAALEFTITEVIGVHEDHDLALLRVESASADGRALPDPLPVAATAPSDLAGRDVYVVGYPAWDGRRNEPEPIRRIFLDVFNVKRLLPGRTVGYSTMYSALEHDCSTLGGNSGSPVVDLETHRILGLHFGGRYGAGNYAVPLWKLADDALLRVGRVNFQ